MKNILRCFLLSVIVISGSCSDDFLDTESTKFISQDRMAEMNDQNPEIFDGTLRGLYSLMFKTGTGGTTGDSDFGQKGYDIFSDMLCGDMVLGGYNYNWYKGIATMSSTVDYTNSENYKPWRYYYRLIRGANSIIDGLGGNEVIPEGENQKWQMGQAKTMRAYAYFYLAHLFVEEYDLNAQILPIYTSLQDVNKPLSKGSEVWGQIKSDLEASSVLLEGFDRGSELFTVNQDVANGFLAYTYLTMGDYTNAAVIAKKVIDKGYNVIPLEKTAYNGSNSRSAFSYVDGDGSEWIWGVDLTLDQGLDLVSWWGHVDLFTYSYAWAGDPKTMDAGLYSSISSSDIRKSQFQDVYGNGMYYPINKFYHEGRSKGGQRDITADYVYMRIEEMYLVKAEAEAFGGDDGTARLTLKELLSKRIGDTVGSDGSVISTAAENMAYVDGLSGQALKDEIYKQWRIEMWGEGKSYLAMMRNKATITREGHIDFNESIGYNDDRLSLDIPYQEYQDNPNISK